MAKINKVHAREIFDSRGMPTVETEIVLNNDIKASVSVPSGASTGYFEACELRDGGKRLNGKGTQKACENVNKIIAKQIIGKNPEEIESIDKMLIEADGTENKSVLGANAILSVSLACAKAASIINNMELYSFLNSYFSFPKIKFYPRPMFNLLNGGLHGGMVTDIQEYMVVPKKGLSMKDYLETGFLIYGQIKQILKKQKRSTAVGDEGGFSPSFRDNFEPIEIILDAFKLAGFEYLKDIFISLDLAANSYYKNEKYVISGDSLDFNKYQLFLDTLVEKYSLLSMEDPIYEEGWLEWQELNARLKTLLIGDDLLVTNLKRLQKAIKEKSCNGIIIKPNQIGTLSETCHVIKLAQANDFQIIISHRSGETCDDFISDLAVACQAQFVKFGALARGERVAKYNRLLKIEFLAK